MMLSSILMSTGIISYAVVWVLYGIIISLFTLTAPVQSALFIYALVPWTASLALVGGVGLKAFGY